MSYRPTSLPLPAFRGRARQLIVATLALSISGAEAVAVEQAETITLVGIARDFADQHPDFGNLSGDHGGLITGIVDTQLADNANPQFTPDGRKVIHEAEDAQGRSIAPHLTDISLGDTPADIGPENRGGVQSESSFAGWFTDQLGLNLSAQVDITFQPIGDGVFVFDTGEDSLYSERGGFFPIDNMLYGNDRTGGGRHNTSFSFELHAGFTYRADMNQFIEVNGNSEVWVYIDGRLVIDLGGIRPSDSRGQYVDLNRLGLEDGSHHTFSLFIANRHRGTPNFRLETNVLLDGAQPMSVTATFD